MKTTTKTKKEYRQPQILAIGDAVELTLAFNGVWGSDWVFTRYAI